MLQEGITSESTVCPRTQKQATRQNGLKMLSKNCCNYHPRACIWNAHTLPTQKPVAASPHSRFFVVKLFNFQTKQQILTKAWSQKEWKYKEKRITFDTTLTKIQRVCRHQATVERKKHSIQGPSSRKIVSKVADRRKDLLLNVGSSPSPGTTGDQNQPVRVRVVGARAATQQMADSKMRWSRSCGKETQCSS